MRESSPLEDIRTRKIYFITERETRCSDGFARAMYLISHETATSVVIIASEEWMHMDAISCPQLVNVQSLKAREHGHERPDDAAMRSRECEENKERRCICKAVVSHNLIFIQAEESHASDKEHRGVERIRRHEIRSEYEEGHCETRRDEVLSEILVEMEHAHNHMEAGFRAKNPRNQKPHKIRNKHSCKPGTCSHYMKRRRSINT